MLTFRTLSQLLNVCSMAEHIHINRVDAVDCAVGLLKSGSVIAVPTETVYGLACDATNQTAIHRLFNVKCRNENKPIALCLGKISDIQIWAETSHLPPILLNNLLPGPVTLILNAINTLDSSLCSNGKVGIRIPKYTFIRDVSLKMGKPLALTSANLSNEPSAISPLEFEAIWGKINAVFEGGLTSIDRRGSTIVDLSNVGVYQIIRDGVALKETVQILQQFNLKEKY